MRKSVAVVVAAAIMAALSISVYVEVLVVPGQLERAVTVFPEAGPLVVPALIWMVVAAGCLQAVALIGLWLTISSAKRSVSRRSVRAGIRNMVLCLGAFLVLVVAAFVTISVVGFGSPGVIIALAGAGIVAFVAVVSLSLFLMTRPQARLAQRSDKVTLMED